MEKQRGSAASPQAEDGFIRIASEIVDALCKVNLSAYESRVLWFILRKTYGWQKKTDWISLSQFSKGTGLDKRHVHRTLKRLQEREIVKDAKLNRNIECTKILSMNKQVDNKYLLRERRTTNHMLVLLMHILILQTENIKNQDE